MDRFRELEAFVAVADAGSFVGAARALGLSPPAITRMVAGLEERVGSRLFNRTTRAVRLTEPGAAFVETARRLLDDLAAAEQDVAGRQGAPTGTLSLTASMTFGRGVLAPVVSDFLAAEPQLRVSMLLIERLVDLVDEGVDLAVRIGALPDSSLVARRVGTVRKMLVASPGYLAARGTPRAMPDLAGHAVIAFTGIVPDMRWAWREGGRAKSVPLAARFEVNDAVTAIAAAEAGQGITGVYSYMVSDALAAGRLVPVLDEFAPEPVPVQFVYPQGRFLAPKVRAFLDFAVPRLERELSARHSVVTPAEAGVH
ncbi:MAG: LysR family transcriptional regulator [Alphaproteobacteria bacterium]|nr:LysR family transcriptional regulator [Alphaproteobacteria bacterium]